jgi:hypothetical protein
MYSGSQRIGRLPKQARRCQRRPPQGAGAWSDHSLTEYRKLIAQLAISTKPPKFRRLLRNLVESKLASHLSILVVPLTPLIHRAFPSEHTLLCVMVRFLR